jgi:hypothetical protein
VSRIDDITFELQGLLAGIEQARAHAITADGQAQEICRRAAGAGFTAMAAGMTRVREAIGDIQSSLSGLTGAIGEAARVTAAIPQEASPEAAITGLAPVREAFAAARGAAAGAASQVDEAQRLVVTTLQGGQPGPVLATLTNIKQVLALLVQRTGDAGRLVDVVIGEARQLGN